MKVLMVNASPRANGNTSVALGEMAKVFEEEGVQVDLLHIGNKDIRDCTACNTCSERNACVFDDVVNEAAALFEQADGLVVGAPVYYGGANATALAFLDRLFYSTGHIDKTMKVGTGLSVARRGGTTTAWDELNKYFGISGMPIASGQYWNAVYGAAPGEAAQDAEGLQQMRTLARNMTFLMKSIQLGKEQFGLPEREPFDRMNFIR